MIKLDVLHKQMINSGRVAILTIERQKLPPVKSRTRVLVDGYEYYVCPGLGKHEEDCSETGAKRGDWKLRVRRA